jgi:hypothetical protein
MVDWNNVQETVGSWSRDNFGDQPAVNPFLGTGEELKELVVELLDEGEPDRDEVLDAVGDMLVFYADFCSRYGVSYANAASMRENVDLYTDCVSVEDLCVELTISRGNQSYSYLKQDQGIRSERDGVGQEADEQYLAHTLAALETFSENYGFSLEEALTLAMNEAMDREWQSSYNSE